jgi:hypothetical protein
MALGGSCKGQGAVRKGVKYFIAAKAKAGRGSWDGNPLP